MFAPVRSGAAGQDPFSCRSRTTGDIFKSFHYNRLGDRSLEPMIRICAWCQVDLSPNDPQQDSPGPISHGICVDCARKLLANAGTNAFDFLETLGEPVFLVDDDARILAGNRRAQAVAGKDLSRIEDQLFGDIVECANARQPGGCGTTVKCRACTIRQAVTETAANGTSVERLPADQDIRTAAGVETVRFYISTERVGEAVLVRIDQAPRA